MENTQQELDKIKKRKEHLQFAKDRAFEILDKQQNPTEAWTSFISDMNNNDETRGHAALKLGMQLMLMGQLSTVDQARKFIDEFN